MRKKMKKLLSVLLCGALGAALLTGCGATGTDSSSKKDDSATEAQASSEDVKVGFLAPTLQTEFMIGIDETLKKECDDRGWDYVSASFDNDSAAAVSAIENMVTGKCNYIVAMVSDTSCDDALKAAQDKGVKIIECGVETAVHDVVITTDQYSIGTQIGDMAAEWLNDQLGGEGNVVVYTTYQNQDMQDRGQGIQDALAEKAPNIKVLEVVDIGKDVVGSGTTTTETMLQKYPDLNGIICYGDAAAVESVEAVKAAGRDNENFGVFACDGTNQALKGINDGTCMRGTMYFEPVGTVMANCIDELLDGKTFDEAVESPIHSVTAANISDYYKAE